VRRGRGHSGVGFEEESFGGGFGVRRPLRFLAHKLDLDDEQVSTSRFLRTTTMQ
jgi:hypothetical protein